MEKEEHACFVINQDALPEKFPTHMHMPIFWESLGRAVATFGFLEDALCKAIFSFTATTPYSEEYIQQAYIEWLPTLERALTDPLGNLIDAYGKAVRNNPSTTIENLDTLLDDLKETSKIRNVLCHGSWGLPDSRGASIPFFVNRKKEVFKTPIDTLFINQVQEHSVDIICAVINTVTHMGWQFPGSNGPGQVIWTK